MKGIVIASSAAAASELICGAQRFCDSVVAISLVGNDAAVCTEKAYIVNAENGIACVHAAMDIVSKEQAQLVLVEQNTDGRYIAAYIAAMLGTSVLTDCKELTYTQDGFTSVRMSYGGSANKTECSGSISVVCVGAGIFPQNEITRSKNIEIVEPEEMKGIKLVSSMKKSVSSVNLGSAKKVIGIGRGIGNPENLNAAQILAQLLDAELACTRPISEEEAWLPKERYVGVSGAIIKPDVYLALGISGQIQHTVGVNNSGLIICVNKDKNAPMFKQSDYGLVGDTAQVIAKLTELIK